MTYQAHNSVLNTAFTAAKCLYLKGTHVGRKEGCKLADMMDVPDAQMRRLGRWDHSRMIQHYSTGLPRQGARMLAGHGEKSGNIYPLYSFLHTMTYEAGNYYLERECLFPSEALQKSIFPLIEEIDAVNQRNDLNLQDIAQ